MKQRRVVLLETNERAGLVADVADACRCRGVSLEISTGPGHILLSFEADDAVTAAASADLEKIDGVSKAHGYAVASGG
jgi:hypothetical protein